LTHADFQYGGESDLARASRRPERDFPGADRTAPPDRAYPEPEARNPDPGPAGPIRFNGLLTAPSVAFGQNEVANKALARRFYEEVWFSRNPAAVDELVAPEYVVHDIGDEKAVRADRGFLLAKRRDAWQNKYDAYKLAYRRDPETGGWMLVDDAPIKSALVRCLRYTKPR